MTSPPTIQETPNDSPLSSPLSDSEIREMDVTELIGLPFVHMSPEQQRVILATMQEIRMSPQVRAAKVRRKSDELGGRAPRGKKVEVRLDDLFGPE